MPSKVFGPYCWNLMFYQLPRILEEFSKVNATAYADDLPVIVDGDSRKELEEKGNHVVIFIDETISERKKKAIVLKSDWVKRKTIAFTINEKDNVDEFYLDDLSDCLDSSSASETDSKSDSSDVIIRKYHYQVIEKYRIIPKTKKWTDITVSEVKKFLGLIVLMGQVKKDVLYDYWFTDATVETTFFSKVMSRNRFLQIMQSWHFCNNYSISPNSHRLAKVQPVIDYLKQKFNDMYKPYQQLSLD
ncbi:uncharacterized protein LOC124957500 [Vespa velutina]|uniref:uncharacterized protein LOC124957500 n=1 Tax=Vespa velutina TaxID=202808 RepID=UPI001FB1E097|nr:uncharacterized protein LOC124957500 [Vespa velutina]